MIFKIALIHAIFILITLTQTFAKIDFFVSPGYLSTEFKVATNYHIFNSPFRTSFSPELEIGSSLPLMLNRWNPDLSGVLPEDIFGLNATFKPIISYGFKPSTQISISLPFMYNKITKRYGIEGAIKAGYVKNLDFLLNLNSSQLEINKYPKESDEIPLRFKAVLNMPLSYYMRWNSFYVNYNLRLNKYLFLGAQIAKHTFELYTNNFSEIDFLGYAEVNNTKIPMQYNLPDKDNDDVYAWAKGNYIGSKWVPTISLKAHIFDITYRKGTVVTLKGSYDMGYSLPFFLKPDSLYDAITQHKEYDDSVFIDWDALLNEPSRIGNSETISRTYKTEDDCYGQIPSSITIGIDIIPQNLNFSWTHFFDSFILNHIDKYKTYFGTNGKDTLATFNRENLYLNVTINNIFLLKASYKYYDLTVGVMDLSISKKRGQWALEKLPMPILGATAHTLTKLQLYISGFISPIPSIKGGFKFQFR